MGIGNAKGIRIRVGLSHLQLLLGCAGANLDYHFRAMISQQQRVQLIGVINKRFTNGG